MNKPVVTRTNHILPFSELSPAQFERLCLWLVEHEGYGKAEHLGEAGSEQGRDVVAYRDTPAGQRMWYFQCKRYQTLTAATLVKEVEKYNDLAAADPTARPFGIVFVTGAVLSAAARKQVKGFCAESGYECEFWARTELDRKVKRHQDILDEFFGLGPLPGEPSPLRNDTISISRLPATSGSDLFGREAELKLLDDAWSHPKTNIVAFDAFGGVGKTSLISHWLKRQLAPENYRGAERVYCWSFYSQGTSDRAASADLFIDQALRWFDDPDPTAGSPWDKGERLAGYIRHQRTLLILDGLEPLQYPPGSHEGRLKDSALATLLVELAARQPGLCVITTRERVGDLIEFENGTVIRHSLERLSAKAGAMLLRAQGARGDDDELEQAVEEYDGHALALTLLGSYLSDVYGGDILRRGEIESLEDDARHGQHAERVMLAYEKWLGDGIELAILRLLGLFDRPADVDSVQALRAEPAIVDLTEKLQGIKGHEWQQALAKLRRIRLLAPQSSNEPNTLDAHPLVREHFRRRLKTGDPDAWSEANNRLYEHLKSTAKEFPDTVKEMSPLYAAIAHGTAAGRYRESYDYVYRRRTCRDYRFFSTTCLGAFGDDLAALSCFFEAPWQEPAAELQYPDSAHLLAVAGFDLLALGRLREAAQPIRAALKADTSFQDWKNAAVAASNLSQLYLTLGDISEALANARSAIEFADRSRGSEQEVSRATLADALHHAGRIEEAEATFREAENIQKQKECDYPFLYSIRGFEFCDLLLGRGKADEVKKRAAWALAIAESEQWLLSIGQDNLSLGRAWMLEPDRDYAGRFTEAAKFLQRAVDGVRQSGTMHELPRVLLARGELYRVTGNFEHAGRDLAEALRIAAHGEMNLFIADYHLESARLHLAQAGRDLGPARSQTYPNADPGGSRLEHRGKAREHWTTAKEMIDRMGYHRRDRELDEIEGALR